VEAPFKESAQPMPAGVKLRSTTGARRPQRYESEPETNEGRKELMPPGPSQEESRDNALAAYICSNMARRTAACDRAGGASALTTVAWLMVMSIGLGAVGLAFAALGFSRADPDPSLTTP
jgi:hypothetical protein